MLIPFSMFAQTEHLKFKGVPIDGTLNQFVAKMQNVGFTKLGQEGKTVILEGDFAGYKDCYIIVSTLDNKDLVNKIAVLFESCDNWRSLENNYLNLKELLTKKYGEPDEVIEKFQNKYVDDDNDKYHELIMDRCNFRTEWKTELGSIILTITFQRGLGSSVALGYLDKANDAVIEQTALDDL
jgi:hypothetical protein